MQVRPYNQAPLPFTGLTFRQSRLWMCVGAAICLLLTSLGVFIILDGAGWFGWVFTGMGALVSLPFLFRAARTFSPNNWLLRYDSRRLFIKIAPVLSPDASSAFVAELTPDEIEWIRPHRQTTITREAGDTTSRSTGYLEINPRVLDLEPLQSAISTAGAPRKWRGWTIYARMPVSITSEGLIRLEWYGRESFVTPSLKKAIQLLGRDFPVQPEVNEHNDLTIPTADKQKMEQQIVELVEQGQLIDATKLVRQRYGYSLAEARTFIEQLQGSRSPSQAGRK